MAKPPKFTTKPAPSTAKPRDPGYVKPTTTFTATTPSSSSSVAPTTPAVNANGFTTEQQSSFDYMAQVLQSYGLGSLSGRLKQLILDGVTDQASLTLALQDTPEWKQRFAGNEALRAKGLPVFSVAEYLSMEHSYMQVLRQYGLPSGFYDDPSDFAQWIGNGVSPAEIQQRAAAYADLANREDPAIIAQLSSMGISKGALAAWMMDPNRAQPLIQKMYSEALIGGAARRAGLVGTNVGHLADIGITEQQAIQGFGEIAQELPTLEKLGDIYRTQIDQADLEGAIFENDAEGIKKRKTLASQERAAFSGSTGIVQGSLRRNIAGSF